MVQEFGGQMLPVLGKAFPNQVQLGRVATGNILKANGILGAGFEWYGFTSGTHGTAFEMGCVDSYREPGNCYFVGFAWGESCGAGDVPVVSGG